MSDLPPQQPPDLPRIRKAVEGYLELGLPGLAEEEIEGIPANWSQHPVALDCRLALQMHRHQWAEAVETGLQGCAAKPGQTSFFIHTAFCLHELGRTEEAHLLLISGPAALHHEPLFHYNVGCYLTVLGRPGEAEVHLTKAFRLDQSLRHFAKKDRDLQPLWPSL